MPATVDGPPYIFISYASVDRERVLPLVDRLAAAGVRVWIDRDGIHGGTNYALEIGNAIEQAAVLILMCEASLASRNVKQEIPLGWTELPERDGETGKLCALNVIVGIAWECTDPHP